MHIVVRDSYTKLTDPYMKLTRTQEGSLAEGEAAGLVLERGGWCQRSNADARADFADVATTDLTSPSPRKRGTRASDGTLHPWVPAFAGTAENPLHRSLLSLAGFDYASPFSSAPLRSSSSASLAATRIASSCVG